MVNDHNKPLKFYTEVMGFIKKPLSQKMNKIMLN
jgi:hypothetical protein